MRCGLFDRLWYPSCSNVVEMNPLYFFVRFLGKLRPRAIGRSIIHPQARIGGGSQIWRCQIGRYSYCGESCIIINCEVGAFCSIADNVVIGAAAHPVEYVSMSPVFLSGRNALGRNFALNLPPETPRSKIGNDVWIGHGAKISGGVEIGDGAVIGMGSVVTRSVAPYTIVGGVPARVIRERFPANISAALAATEWWLLDEEQLIRHGQLFQDPENYLQERDSL